MFEQQHNGDLSNVKFNKNKECCYELWWNQTHNQKGNLQLFMLYHKKEKENNKSRSNSGNIRVKSNIITKMTLKYNNRLLTPSF